MSLGVGGGGVVGGNVQGGGEKYLEEMSRGKFLSVRNLYTTFITYHGSQIGF